jgi:hypothetical protein
MDLLECLLPTRKVLVVPWIFALAVLHIPRAVDDREVEWPKSSRQSAGHAMGVIYQPIIEAFAEVPAYLSIAAGVGLLETIRLLAR